MPKQVIMQKFYVYDPGVTAGDEFGGQLVRIDPDEKGNYVLAPMLTMQYWIDQGLAGLKPVGELSGPGKAILAQITRGRSENPDKDPRRLPKYDKRVQSGGPAFAATTASTRLKKLRARRAAEAEPKPTDASKTAATPPRTPTYVGPAPAE